MKKMRHITISQWGQFHTLYLPLYVAYHAGIFKNLGLDVTINPVGNDDEVYRSLIEGKADFTVSDPIYAAIGHERKNKVPIKAVATLVNKIAIWGITGQSTVRPVKQIEDLAGLRLGCFPKGSTVQVLLSGLKKNHPRLLNRTTIVEGGIDNQVALLARGEVDIALEIEPVVSYAVSKGYKEVFSLAHFFGDCVFTGLCTRQDIIDANPELVADTVKAFQQAMDLIYTDKDIALDVACKMFPDVAPEVQKISTERILKEMVWPTHVAIDEKSWRAAQQNWVNVGDLKKIQLFEETVDNRFAIDL